MRTLDIGRRQPVTLSVNVQGNRMGCVLKDSIDEADLIVHKLGTMGFPYSCGLSMGNFLEKWIL